MNKNSNTYHFYVECINKKKDVSGFEISIKNMNIDKNELIVVIKIIKNNPNQFSVDFIEFIFKESIKLDYFLTAIDSSKSNENFLLYYFFDDILKKINCTEYFLEKLILSAPRFIFFNMNYIKKILKQENLLDKYREKIETVYFDEFCNDENIERVLYKDYISSDLIQDFIFEKNKNENTISKNYLMSNKYKLMREVLIRSRKVVKNFNLENFLNDIKKEDTKDKNIENIKINAKSNNEQTICMNAYNKYINDIIYLLSVRKIYFPLFCSKTVYIKNDIQERINFAVHVKKVLISKYNISDIEDFKITEIFNSVNFFLSGSSSNIFGVIPILEKYFSENAPNDIYENPEIIEEIKMLKNIFLKKYTFINKTKKLAIENAHNYTFDIRTKFAHGQFLDQMDENLMAIYTYMTMVKILDLDDLFS